MGIKDSNYVSYGGFEIKKEHPVQGCLITAGIIAGTVLILSAAVLWTVNNTLWWSGMTENPVLYDEEDVFEFILPPGWFNPDSVNVWTSYRILKPFENFSGGSIKSIARIWGAGYGKMKIKKEFAGKNPIMVLEKLREHEKKLRIKELKYREFENTNEAAAGNGAPDLELKKFSAEKDYYKAEYKKENRPSETVYYYFRCMHESVFVMKYRYEGSEQKAAEQIKELEQMWKKTINRKRKDENA
ncbi:MAG: hypothetical protein ACOC4H_03285 [bacterium]